MSRTRMLAVMRRELAQLARDPFLLTAAFLTPCLLMIVLGYGISFDIERLPYGVLDRDRTSASRRYVEGFRHSPYFGRAVRLGSPRDLERQLVSGTLAFAIEIGEGFQRRLERGEMLPVSIWVDGAIPFRAEIARGYVEGSHASFLRAMAPATEEPGTPELVVTRFRYNEGLRSRIAFVPSLIGALLAMIPPLLTAVAVAREKELGSIVNLYATPLRPAEFLLGKQLPYVVVCLVVFLLLFGLATLLFRVPLHGGFASLFAGAALYVSATTALGLVISSFTRTQVAALLVTFVLTLLPAFLYSGFFTPVASLTGAARVIAAIFPAGYFIDISVGAFVKGRTAVDFLPSFLTLGAFALAFDGIALALLREQER